MLGHEENRRRYIVTQLSYKHIFQIYLDRSYIYIYIYVNIWKYGKYMCIYACIIQVYMYTYIYIYNIYTEIKKPKTRCVRVNIK